MTTNASIIQPLTDFNPSLLDSITGFLLPDEAALLYWLAAEVPKAGTIVEIGSYQGKSTVALGLGAKVSNADVWAIDPHNPIANSSVPFGLNDQIALFRNLLTFDLAGLVRVISLPGYFVNDYFGLEYMGVDLIFIDADHTYDEVSFDLAGWSEIVRGKIALHDYANPDFPGVRRAVDELVSKGEWCICERVDTIAVLKHV